MLSWGVIITEKPYHHGNLRQELLEKALEHVQNFGIAQLSVRKISEGLGVSPAAAYRHFADKQSLVNTLAVEKFDQLAAKASAQVKRAKEPQARIEALALAYVGFAHESPEFFRLMFEGIDPTSSDEALSPAFAGLFALLGSLVTESRAAGELTRADALQVSLSIWAAAHGIAMLWIEHRLDGLVANKQQLNALVKTHVGALYRGLSA